MNERSYPGAAKTAARIRSGRLSQVDLVEDCLRRIKVLDDRLRAWAAIDRQAALDMARSLERELEEGRPRGPLHGIPVGVKDVYYTAGIKTSAGSKVLEDFVPEYSATAVRRLTGAGAIVLGKTACTEFAATIRRLPATPGISTILREDRAVVRRRQWRHARASLPWTHRRRVMSCGRRRTTGWSG